MAGILVAMVAAFGAVACGQPDGDDALTASAVDEATRSVGRFRFVSETEFPEPVENVEPDPPGDIVIEDGVEPLERVEGQVDLEAGWMWAGAPGGPPAVVVDDTPPAALLRSDLLPATHRPPTAWVSFDDPGASLAHLPADLRGMVSVLGAESHTDPAEFTDMLKRYGATLHRDGQERVRGVETTRHRVRYDTERYRAAILAEFDAAMAQVPDAEDDPEFSRKEFRRFIESAVPPETTIWVDDQGRLRRSESSPVAPDGEEDFGSVVMRLELFDFGAVMDIAHPGPADITPAATLNLPEPQDDPQEPWDNSQDDGDVEEVPDFPVPVRSRLSLHPVESHQPGLCATAGEPFFNGRGVDDEPLCYRLGPAALDRPMLTRAALGNVHTGCDIEIHLSADDATRFEAISAASLGRQLAIVVDGELLSAPTVNSVIEGGEVCISGGFSTDEAQRILDRLTG